MDDPRRRLAKETTGVKIVIKARGVNKLALVVGVNNSSIAPPYRPTLKYAEKDAQDMASLLEQPSCSFTLLVPTLTGEYTTSGNIKQRVNRTPSGREKKKISCSFTMPAMQYQ